MRNLMLLIGLVVLTACADQKVVLVEPLKNEQNEINQPFGEKCKNAKYQLDKTVEEGQLSNLRELKQNIELYCVWRRN